MAEKGFEVSVTIGSVTKRNVQHVTPLGSHRDKTVFGLEIFIPRTGILPVIVDGRKNLIIMHGVPKKLNEQFRPFKVRKEIPQHGIGNHASTHYPENNVRLIEWGEQGHFSVHECAIVVQNNIAFYSCQETYAERCFLQNGKIVCPRFEAPWTNRPWPQLVQLLKPGFFKRPLPSIETWNPAEVSIQQLDVQQGKVLWFNNAMGYGAILLADGETARVHWKNIATTANDFRTLSAGDIVTYECLEQIRQGAGTSFTQDCVGVMLCAAKRDTKAALR